MVVCTRRSARSVMTRNVKTGRIQNTGSALETVGQDAAESEHADDGGMFGALRDSASFRDLWFGTIVTNTAFWMYQIAVGWLALDLTDSPFFVGLTGFAGGIPLLFLALPAGVVIDRIDRRTVLLCAQVGIMVISTIFAVLVATDSIQRWSILVLSLCYGSVMSFVFPTRNALVPSFVPRRQLRNAVALNAAGQNATRVLGPSLAGVLIALTGVAGTFAVAAVAQVAALAWTSRLPRAERSGPQVARSLLGSVSEGVSVVFRDRFLTGLILLSTVATVLIMPYINLLPVFARDELGMGATGLGFLMACSGIGSVAGALGVAGWRKMADTRGIQIISALAFAVAVMAFALTSLPVLAGVLLVASGAASAALMSINNTVLQLKVDDAVRGRVLSIYMLTWGLLPVGQLPIGAFADEFGAPAAVFGATLLAIAWIVFLAFRYPDLRR